MSSINKQVDFNFNFDTKPTTASFSKIAVSIDPESMVVDYAKAYEAEMQRKNPLKYESIQTQISGFDPNSGEAKFTLVDYFKFIVYTRVLCVHDMCTYFRKTRSHYIPSWMVYVMMKIGIVLDHDKGLQFDPYIKGMDLNQIKEWCIAHVDHAYDVSCILRSFEQDGLHLIQDGYPRSKFGDKEFMSLAVVESVVMAMDYSIPMASYVAAFLQFEIDKNIAESALYRIRYDDVQFIKQQLLSERTIY